MRNRRSIFFALANGFLMLLLALYWLGLPRTFGDEAFFIKWTSLVKKSVLGMDEQPAAGSFLYVDVSGAKMIVEEDDPFYQEPTGYQKRVLTDREQLADFLFTVASYGEDIPLVLLDLTFEAPSVADSLLQSALDTLPFPTVGAVRLDAEGVLVPNIFRLATGAANYRSTDGQFLKYPLFARDTLPSLPLAAYRATDSVSVGHWLFGSRIGPNWYLPNPIIDFKVRPFDISDGVDDLDRAYDLRSIGTLLFEWTFWDEADIRELLRGKTIVLGDFKNDVHGTVFGSMPGPLIVHNALLNLQNRENRIYLRWLLLLYALFSWMSWRIYREKEDQSNKHWLISGRLTAVGRILVDSIDDTLLLVMGTILSYFLFNVHINILILLIYLKVIAFLLEKLYFKPTNLSRN